MSPYIVPGLKEKQHFSTNTMSKEEKMCRIVDVVCSVMKVNKNGVFNKGRKREMCTARQLSIFLIRRDHPEISLKDTGEYFAGRDHTTAIHSIQAAKNLLETDPGIRSTMTKIESLL